LHREQLPEKVISDFNAVVWTKSLPHKGN